MRKLKKNSRGSSRQSRSLFAPTHVLARELLDKNHVGFIVASHLSLHLTQQLLRAFGCDLSIEPS